MRGLWRTIAYIAENKDSFNKALDAFVKFDQTNKLLDKIGISSDAADNRVLNLHKQPTVGILQAVDTVLRAQRGLILTAYELAEVNRIAYETQPDGHKDLTDYWKGLNGVGDKYRNDPNFMEAVGALAIDGQLRYNFADQNMSLIPWFHLQDQQQSDLRPMLHGNGPSDNAARAYFGRSWPSGACASIASPWSSWVHLNA